MVLFGTCPFQALFIMCALPTQDLFPGLSLHTGRIDAFFFSSLSLEKVGSFLVYISVVLELVSVIQLCLLEPSLQSSLLLLFFFFKLLSY